jgi:LuxR family glucitol operon transcriptional activator
VGGLPLAADITIGRFAAADQDTRDSLLSNLSEPARHSEELLNYIFEDTFAGLRAQEPRSYRALLALSIFNRAAGATKQDLAAVLKISENTCATYLAPLLVRNLIHRDTRSNDRSNTHLTYYTMLAITHDRVRDILTQNPTEERRLRSRWIDYYLEYTSLYGGHDHVGDWADSYDYLEDEWPNLKDVFDYCTANDRFDDLAKFWLDGRVGDFADLYHHWSRRLDWLTWLIDNAENDSKRRAELAKAMSSKAWILILTGEVKEAQALLVRAWRLRHELSPAAQCVVVNHIIALRERQDKCDRALFWVRKHEAMVSQLPAPSSSPDLAGERAVEDERRLRHKINGDFFHGMILLRLKQTAEARAIFTVMRRMSQELGYLRARIYAENYLADIAIGEGGEENLATARVYLERALDIATRNNDLRRVACCLSSTAHLYETQGENNRARSRAAPARELFERLGMEAEAGEMAALLQRLDH